MKLADYRYSARSAGPNLTQGITSTRERIRRQVKLIRTMRADGMDTTVAYLVLGHLLQALSDLRESHQVLQSASRVLLRATIQARGFVHAETCDDDEALCDGEEQSP